MILLGPRAGKTSCAVPVLLFAEEPTILPYKGNEGITVCLFGAGFLSRLV